ncbi:MAG: hypothetical protein ACFFCS_16050 [Candidatus Hodarchaeota archaeon]
MSEMFSIWGLVLIISLGAIFFLVDLYENKLAAKSIHPSYIAGFSIAYFFLVVLPEITTYLPDVLKEFTVFEYVFILIGVTFALTSEKLILQRVEVKTRVKVKELHQLKSDLDHIEESLGIFLAENIIKEKLDMGTMKNVSEALIGMNEKEEDIKLQIKETEQVIHDHVCDSLDDFHAITEFIYHLIIGIILSSLLLTNILEGILFFVFAFFMAIVTRSKTKKRVFSDLDIEIGHVERKKKKLIVALAAPIGIGASLFLEMFLHLQLAIVYVFFSFISGVILYTIMREVIPEKEKGRPIYFLIGLAVFSVVIITLRMLEITLHHV